MENGSDHPLGETAKERAAHGSSFGDGLRLAVFLSIGLWLFALGGNVGEIYPSMTLPSFRYIPQIDPIPLDLELTLSSPSDTRTLSLPEAFSDAPPSNHIRLLFSAIELTGTPEEWAWIERLATTYGIDECVSSMSITRTKGTDVDTRGQLNKQC